jgi:hypothetical protein
MMNIFLILVISYSVFSCKSIEKNNDSNNTTQKDSIIDTKTEKLQRAFERNDYATFFELFPDTYSELIDFYGFDDTTGERPLYFKAKHHIPFLFNGPKEYLRPLVKKSIKISVDGKWKADAVSCFQDELIDLIIKFPNEFLEILTTRPDKEVVDFWHFVFDGSGKYDLQNKENFEALYRKINSLNKAQGALLKDEFERMYK